MSRADGVFECAHTSFKLEHLHVQGSLLAAERSDLLLVASILLLLMSEMALYVLLHLEELISKGLAHVLCL